MKQTIQFEQETGHEPLTLQVAPMVDIVMLLICFFLLASQLVQGQKDPTVLLPWMRSTLSASEVRSEVTVNLRADGLITIEGQPVAMDSLPALLAGKADRARRAHQPFRVVVRADRRQRFAALDDVLVACRRAGLGQVVFRATQEEGS
ncbi:MAG: biopolymer transporter ExbD [Planctomycetota bacterium]|nr:biopolymer transporter ExbD [Planctomycetota bacterium]